MAHDLGKALGKGLAVCMKDGGGMIRFHPRRKNERRWERGFAYGTVESVKERATALSQIVAEELGISL